VWANTPMALPVGGRRRKGRKAVSCKRGMRKEEQGMKVSASRNELVVFSVVLVILIALAVSPVFWETASGQESKMTNVAVETCGVEGTVRTRSVSGHGERLPGASLEVVNVGLNSSHVWVSRTSR